MEHLNLLTYIIVISSFLCLFFSILTFMEKRKNRILSRQLKETTTRLEVTAIKLQNIKEINGQSREFYDSLQVAELTTKLQKPRLEAQKIEAPPPPLGKYSTVPSLAQQGMSAEEIASVLAISTHEALQLVNLARLAQGNFASNAAN